MSTLFSQLSTKKLMKTQLEKVFVKVSLKCNAKNCVRKTFTIC
jgi:hypothetical protein